MILTYEQYTNLGFNAVSEQSFPKYEIKARYYLEYLTMNRVLQQQKESVEEKIRFTMCTVIDLLFDYENKLKSIQESDNEIIASGLKSESIKSHSMSFRDVTKDSQSELLKGTEEIIYSTIKRMLVPTGLLYRGL